MQIQSTTEKAQDMISGLVLARPERRFVTSYIEALKEGMEASRHKDRQEEIDSFEEVNEQIWKMFAETCPNSTGTDNFCMEDMFWLTREDIFIGYIILRKEMGPQREKYGGNTGRVFRPSQRGKGYGNIGLEMTKILAKNRGYNELVMVTSADNIPAQRSWERCGGIVVERFEGPVKDYYSNGAVKYKITL